MEANEADSAGAAVYGSVYITLYIQNTSICNNAAFRYGGAVAIDSNSMIDLNGCYICKNSADIAGAIYSKQKTTVIVKQSKFEGNEANIGATMAVEESGLYVDKCNFARNYASLFGGATQVERSQIVKIANSTFSNNLTMHGKDIYYVNLKPKPFKLDTYVMLFKLPNFTLRSYDNNFKKESLNEGVLHVEGAVIVTESPYASGT